MLMLRPDSACMGADLGGKYGLWRRTVNPKARNRLQSLGPSGSRHDEPRELSLGFTASTKNPEATKDS